MSVYVKIKFENPQKKNHLYEINAPIIKSYNHPDGPRVASVSLPTLSRIILHFLCDLIPPSVGSGAFLCYHSVTEVCLQLVMGCHQLQRRDFFFFFNVSVMRVCILGENYGVNHQRSNRLQIRADPQPPASKPLMICLEEGKTA